MRSVVVDDNNDIVGNNDDDVLAPLSFSSNNGNDAAANENDVESEAEAKQASEAAVGLESEAMVKEMLEAGSKVDKVDGTPTSPSYVASLEET